MLNIDKLIIKLETIEDEDGQKWFDEAEVELITEALIYYKEIYR